MTKIIASRNKNLGVAEKLNDWERAKTCIGKLSLAHTNG
jgi:hypothetical protein